MIPNNCLIETRSVEEDYRRAILIGFKMKKIFRGNLRDIVKASKVQNCEAKGDRDSLDKHDLFKVTEASIP